MAGKISSLKQMTLDVGETVADHLKGDLSVNENFTRYSKKVKEIPFRANIEFLKLVKYTRTYLKEIESPVFIAQGRQDELVPHRTAQYLDKEIGSKEIGRATSRERVEITNQVEAIKKLCTTT